MTLKKILLAAAAAAMIGGLGLAPSATAGEGDVQCNKSTSIQSVPGVVTVYGEAPGSEGGGCLILEGGGIPVNPIDAGYIGLHEGDEDNEGPTLVGDCDGAKNEAGDFNTWDPTAGGGDTATACEPGPA